jgi:iron(III) transport system permease protein
MTRWRGGAALALALVVGAPLLLPLLDTALAGMTGWTRADLVRLVSLYAQTLSLVGGVLLIALPLGTVLGLLAFRTQWPGRKAFVALTALLLFVPPSIQVSAWQTLLGSDGLLPQLWWGTSAGRPWTSGLGPAIWIHALAALPWAIFLVGLAARRVERELEEEGLLYNPPLWVLWHITLPRCRAAILFAGVWIALQAAGDITVTDMLQVSTIAEEVYTQFTLGENEAAARSVAAGLPLLLAAWLALCWYAPRLDAGLPVLATHWREPLRLPLGPAGRIGCVIAAALVLAVLAAPLASLVWRLGQAGHPPRWVAGDALRFLGSELRLNGWHTFNNLVLALAVGAVVSVAAWVCCWLARESPWFRRLLFGIAVLAWTLPGPVIGASLKSSIGFIVAWFPDGVIEAALYRGPSPLPLSWAWGVRTFPCAVALLWPVVRLVPREAFESLRLESPSGWREFRLGVVPQTWRAAVVCGVAVAALSLAEVAASGRVDTPGWESYSKLLFGRMHYGVENSVAGLGLVLLGQIAALFLAIGALRIVRIGVARKAEIL